MIYAYIFSVFGVFLFAFFALPTIYQFQIKEYNLDRLKSSLGESNNGVFIPMKMPAKSIRNLLIFIFVFLGLAVYYALITYSFADNVWVIYFLFWILGTIFAKFLVFLGTLVTQPFAKYHRKKIISKAISIVESSDTLFIGITGSYGKSSVKEMMYEVFSSEFNIEKSPANFNTDVGIAMSVLQKLKDNTKYFIAEMGAYKLGEIQDICDIVHPHYGIITALGNQHLDIFGSRENLINTKAELIRSIPSNGISFVNYDSDGINMALKGVTSKVVRYSIENQEAEIFLKNRLYKKGYTQFTLIINSEERIFKTRLPGKHSIQNLMPVIGLGLELGIDIEKIEDAIYNMKPVHGKLSLHKGYKKSTYINDAYNSSLDGFLAGIKYLNSFETAKKCVLSKGIIELGNEKRSSYRKILDELTQAKIPMYTTDKLFYELEPTHVKYFKDEDSLLATVASSLDVETTVLVEGRFSPHFISSLDLSDE